MQARSNYRWAQIALGGCLAATIFSSSAHAITPDNPGAAAIQFSLNSGQGVKAISPYIYGSNTTSITNRTLDRAGGNRWTGYNWENNASNAGSDWYNHSDYGLVPGNNSNAAPGAAVEPMITAAATAGRASIITVPIAGYVAADGNGTVDETQLAPSSRWKQVVPKKSTIYPDNPVDPNSATLPVPDKTEGYVFTDEFAKWAKVKSQPGQQVFYSLDNEPGLWGESLPAGWQSGVEPNPCCNPANGTNPSAGGRTHPTLHPYAPTFVELRDKTIANATAIKDAVPGAMVFGGVGYGWNDFTSLQDAPDAAAHQMPAHPGGDQSGEMHFYEYLLQEVHNAEVAQGRKLMDVLDFHWYPEATGGGVRITGSETTTAVVNARVQAPRSLWDSTYTETSWISQWGTWVGSPGTPGPIKLLPRAQRDIDDFNPGTKISITEYNYGAGNHYSGGIAQADFLGILGQQGVFAASWWDLGTGSSYVNAAFNIFRNYNGTGGKFGDTSVGAETSNIANSAVYASVDSTNPNRMIVVAINRTGSTQTTGIAVTNDRVFDHAEVYGFNGNSPTIVRGADISLNLLNAFQYTMPAWSVTTFVLISDGLSGDFNHDHMVDAADFTVWRDTLGQTGNTAADANEDNVVDNKDYDLWKSNFGRSEAAGSGSVATVPEPSSFLLAAWIGIAIGTSAIRRRG